MENLIVRSVIPDAEIADTINKHLEIMSEGQAASMHVTGVKDLLPTCSLPIIYTEKIIEYSFPNMLVLHRKLKFWPKTKTNTILNMQREMKTI